MANRQSCWNTGAKLDTAIHSWCTATGESAKQDDDIVVEFVIERKSDIVRVEWQICKTVRRSRHASSIHPISSPRPTYFLTISKHRRFVLCPPRTCLCCDRLFFSEPDCLALLFRHTLLPSFHPSFIQAHRIRPQPLLILPSVLSINSVGISWIGMAVVQCFVSGANHQVDRFLEESVAMLYIGHPSSASSLGRQFLPPVDQSVSDVV